LENGERIRKSAAALIHAAPDITATGNAEAISWLEDIEVALDGYRGSHQQHAALLVYFGLVAEALGTGATVIPAVRTAAGLAGEYATTTRRPG
jgi:hypothetical protein